MTRRHLAAEGLAALFPTVQRSSWRWEAQGYYAADAAELAAWQAGAPLSSTPEDAAWLDYIRSLSERGIPFERVRTLTDPPNDYARWMLSAVDGHVAAGEDIRWIQEDVAAALGAAPTYDFYLFDDGTPDARVVLFEFDDGKILVDVVVDDDPDVVAAHREWRDLVWPHAIPHKEMVTARP